MKAIFSLVDCSRLKRHESTGSWIGSWNKQIHFFLLVFLLFSSIAIFLLLLWELLLLRQLLCSIPSLFSITVHIMLCIIISKSSPWLTTIIKPTILVVSCDRRKEDHVIALDFMTSFGGGEVNMAVCKTNGKVIKQNHCPLWGVFSRKPEVNACFLENLNRSHMTPGCCKWS